MNPTTVLFEPHTDWLSHTLANAGVTLPAISTELADGTSVLRVDTGLLWLEPPAGRVNSNDEALILSAGVHGNETAPIEVLNGLVCELLNGDWQLACPTLMILGNPPAMVAGERFTGVNMNRLFNGAHLQSGYQGQPEARRAAALEQACRDFAEAHARPLSHYDLHTAIRPSHRERFALYPFVAGRRVPVTQCRFLLESDVPTLLLQHKAGTTFSSFSSTTLGAESFTVELGKVRPFGENDLSRFCGIADGLRRRLRGLPPPESAGELTIFEVVHEILNTGSDFCFHVPDDVANFTEYPPGTLIWEDSATSYRVGSVPEAIIFPNRNVPVGQRVGLMVRPRQHATT